MIKMIECFTAMNEDLSRLYTMRLDAFEERMDDDAMTRQLRDISIHSNS